VCYWHKVSVTTLSQPHNYKIVKQISLRQRINLLSEKRTPARINSIGTHRTLIWMQTLEMSLIKMTTPPNLNQSLPDIWFWEIAYIIHNSSMLHRNTSNKKREKRKRIERIKKIMICSTFCNCHRNSEANFSRIWISIWKISIEIHNRAFKKLQIFQVEMMVRYYKNYFLINKWYQLRHH